MATIERALKSVKSIFFSTAIVLTLVQCSEEEIVAEESIVEDMTTEIMSEAVNVASISVEGVYTEVQGDVSCNTCTYVVAPAETTVDGKELGLKPGSVICLRKSLQYSSVDFVNLEGTEENPIVIGYCAE